MEEPDTERHVPSQQPLYAKKAGTAYIKKRRPGWSRGGASLSAAPIGPCNVNVRNPARETQAGWRGRGAGWSLLSPPASGRARPPGCGETPGPLRPTGALPPPLCHGGAECTELRQWGFQLPLPSGGVELARAQRVREGGRDTPADPGRATGQPEVNRDELPSAAASLRRKPRGRGSPVSRST